MAHPNTLGIDFGTSNSAAGVCAGGQPYLIPMEPCETTLPTAVFFDADSKKMRIGRSATRALIEGEDGRFMRALKSLLGTSLLHEKRRLSGKSMDFSDIITQFLREIKTRSEVATRQEFTHALSGRPVRFHSKDDAKDAQAQVDLRKCYLAAGFQDVTFMYEPEAALRATPAREGLGIIVDIGGGTSDFTCFEQNAQGDTKILASHGLRLGGTDFDRQLSIDHVMPLLGHGTHIRNSFGNGTLPAPNRLFTDLATWQMIPFMYGPDSRRAARDLAQHAVEPDKIRRLTQILEDELGHDLAFAVEQGKISVNNAGSGDIDLRIIERGLRVPLQAQDMAQSLQDMVQEIRDHTQETLTLAGVNTDQITRCIMVGGSALLTPIRAALAELCTQGQQEDARALTAVADGLALAAHTAFD